MTDKMEVIVRKLLGELNQQMSPPMDVDEFEKVTAKVMRRLRKDGGYDYVYADAIKGLMPRVRQGLAAQGVVR